MKIAELPQQVLQHFVPGDEVYEHPQGAYIIVRGDTLLGKIRPDGKRADTSADVKALRGNGHGRWRRVHLDDDLMKADGTLDVPASSDIDDVMAWLDGPA